MGIIKNTSTSLHLAYNQIFIVTICSVISIVFLGFAVPGLLAQTTQIQLVCQKIDLQTNCNLTEWKWLERSVQKRPIDLQGAHIEKRSRPGRSGGTYSQLVLDTSEGAIDFAGKTSAAAFIAQSEIRSFLKQSQQRNLQLEGVRGSLIEILIGSLLIGFSGSLTGIGSLTTPMITLWKFEKDTSGHTQLDPENQADRTTGEVQIYLRGLFWEKLIFLPFDEITAIEGYRGRKGGLGVKVCQRHGKPINLCSSYFKEAEWRKITTAMSKILGMEPPQLPPRHSQKPLIQL